MTMRLDYVLYALAVIFFVAAVVTMFVIPEADGRLLYVASTAVLGVVFACSGYLMRPKPATQAVAPAPAAAPEPAMPAEPEQPKPKAPEPAAPKPTVPTVPEVQPAEMKNPAAPPATVTPEIKPQAEKLAAAKEDVKPAESAAPAETELTKIRGINQKRADQLSSCGVNTIEDLAKASAEEIATKLEISPRIVKMWIGTAKKQVK
ncbi:MAG: helix-hairpin-helix domain-containing protein [Candidatus Bathyarchaeota archaeon]|nr:helix-hairpin-helix domain-containing protein [Candidatus Bathyarchaeota archaeon]